MKNPIAPLARIVFDEVHSESWSVSPSEANRIQPSNPDNSSYFKASEALRKEGFVIDRITANNDFATKLQSADILVILHPCDPEWESTTGIGTPIFNDHELVGIENFVASGGGLLIITEYEYSKYNSNLNEIVRKFGITIQNDTVSNPFECLNDNRTWVLSCNDPLSKTPISVSVDKACFYRSGSCLVRGGNASIVTRTSTQSNPDEGLIASSSFGKGRVVVCCDSDIFGDEYFDNFSHRILWENIFFWLVEDIEKRTTGKIGDNFTAPKEWEKLKDLVNQLGALQEKDGSVSCKKEKAQALTVEIEKLIPSFKEQMPYNDSYLNALLNDLKNWRNSGLQKPDFKNSITSWNPQDYRKNNVTHITLFPMYLPNATETYRFEAALWRVSWPDWMEEFERQYCGNKGYLPGILEDYSIGFDSECAVLFPEMVSVSTKTTNHFGVIFCNREAERFRKNLIKTAQTVNMDMPPAIAMYENSKRLCTYSFMLWDIVHDRIHSEGHLPFDPFMVKQRMPYWMYGIEELRVDIGSYVEFMRLEEKIGFSRYVKHTILFDRIFRFPISGERKRNYDGLSGQILFGYLYNTGIIEWKNLRLKIHWERLDSGFQDLGNKIDRLYEMGVNLSKAQYWIETYNFVSNYVRPNISSKFYQYLNGHNSNSLDEEKGLLDLINEDEFPLNLFYSNLKKLHE